MVHAYCEIRDSWTGWLRGSAMGRTLYERIIPEMRALQEAERHIIDNPSVTLLAVLDFAARARQAVPAYTPRQTIDHPQPPVSKDVREACVRMVSDAEKAALAARRASAREYAARMADATQRERAEEARRQKAMRDHGVTETPEEAAQAATALEARIEVYERERRRVLADAGLTEEVAPEGARQQVAPETCEAATQRGAPAAPGHTVLWRVAARRFNKTFLTPTPETAPAFARRLVLIDRGRRVGALRAIGGTELDGRRETVNGVSFCLSHFRGARYEARLTPAEVREMRA